MELKNAPALNRADSSGSTLSRQNSIDISGKTSVRDRAAAFNKGKAGSATSSLTKEDIVTRKKSVVSEVKKVVEGAGKGSDGRGEVKPSGDEAKTVTTDSDKPSVASPVPFVSTPSPTTDSLDQVKNKATMDVEIRLLRSRTTSKSSKEDLDKLDEEAKSTPEKGGNEGSQFSPSREGEGDVHAAAPVAKEPLDAESRKKFYARHKSSYLQTPVQTSEEDLIIAETLQVDPSHIENLRYLQESMQKYVKFLSGESSDPPRLNFNDFRGPSLELSKFSAEGTAYPRRLR